MQSGLTMGKGQVKYAVVFVTVKVWNKKIKPTGIASLYVDVRINNFNLYTLSLVVD